MKNYYQNQILANSATFTEREVLIEQGKKDGIFYPPQVGDILYESCVNGFSIITAVDKYSVKFIQYARFWNESKKKFQYTLWNDNAGRQIDCFYDDALHGAVKQLEPQDITLEIKEIAISVLSEKIIQNLKTGNTVEHAAEWCRLQKRRSGLKNQSLTA